MEAVELVQQQLEQEILHPVLVLKESLEDSLPQIKVAAVAVDTLQQLQIQVHPLQ